VAEAVGARAGVTVRRSRGEVYTRHASDALRVVLGAVIVVLCTQPVRPDRIGTQETNVFRLINDLPIPDFLYPLIWFLMQLGNLGAVPLVVVAAAATRRWRLALDAAVAGGAIYVVARVIKQFVERGRPQTLLDNVHILGEPARGLGYVSGHSAVAVALATVASPYLGRRGRRIAWAGAVVVCLSRVYVGAHLPLDVLGGAALGWAAGSLVHLLLGAPRGRPSLARVHQALDRYGLDPVELQPIEPDSRRSASYYVTSKDRRDLFVKVVPRERRDGDLLWRTWRLLWRTWRWLTRLGRAGPPQFAPPVQQVEHEASMALLAAASGVRAPAVLVVRPFGNGAGLLVQHRVAGLGLDRLAAERVDEALLGEVWQQVIALHQARIAHGDLQPASFVVDDDGHPWLVDFDRAVAAASQRQLDQDTAGLLASLSLAADPARVAASARLALGPDGVERAAVLLDSRDLSPATRRALRARPEVREQLKA